MNSKRKIAILGSTGSIGTQALDVIKQHPDMFEVYAITANNNVDLLIKQAKEFNPEVVIIVNENKYLELKEALKKLPIKVWSGYDAISQVVSEKDIDIVLTAMTGFSGLIPTINAIKSKKTVALANKETLVVAGELITSLAIENNTPIIPVDSEHSAIFQCLNGEHNNKISKLILTASGGPFRTYSQKDLHNVTAKDALKHPSWTMGSKITINSSTLINKGFELIEAKWLFDIDISNIEIVIHPQSIIHSMVQFEDTSIIAQLGNPDMRIPIQYALSYPHRLKSNFKELNFFDLKELSFEKPNLSIFRNLEYSYQAIKIGGNMPCILNAANEIAVDAFLKNKIKFLYMSEIIEKTMEAFTISKNLSLNDYINTDKEARRIASNLITK